MKAHLGDFFATVEVEIGSIVASDEESLPGVCDVILAKSVVWLTKSRRRTPPFAWQEERTKAGGGDVGRVRLFRSLVAALFLATVRWMF